MAGRIEKTYRQDGTEIHPTVDVDRFKLQTEKDDHYLAVSRFVPCKPTETTVDVFIGTPVIA